MYDLVVPSVCANMHLCAREKETEGERRVMSLSQTHTVVCAAARLPTHTPTHRDCCESSQDLRAGAYSE